MVTKWSWELPVLGPPKKDQHFQDTNILYPETSTLHIPTQN